ncbi:hypothetical protein FXO37_31497 [Capsicum annuum]|nr:hypothetical protein FXO37_31497 [Capsicum annuum]
MEWMDFYRGTKKGPFLLGLVSELYRQAEVPDEPDKIMAEMDIPFHPLLVRVTLSQKRKTGAELRRRPRGDDNNDDDFFPSQPQLSIPSNQLEVDLAAVKRFIKQAPSSYKSSSTVKDILTLYRELDTER